MIPDLPDYADLLRAAVSGYRGPRERSVRRAADVFDFFAALFADPALTRSDRELVNAVLAYFVVRDDYLPEDTLGPVGLVDDLFVAAHAFRSLQRALPPEVLLGAWHAEDDLVDAMAEIHHDCRAELGRKARDVIRLAGLS